MAVNTGIVLTFTAEAIVAHNLDSNSSDSKLLANHPVRILSTGMRNVLNGAQEDTALKNETVKDAVEVYTDEVRTINKRSVRQNALLRVLLFRAKRKANQVLRLYCFSCSASRYLRYRCPDVRHKYMTCERFAKFLARRQSENVQWSSEQNEFVTSTCSVLQTLTISLASANAVVYRHDRIIFNSDTYTDNNDNNLSVSTAMFELLGYIRNLNNQVCGSPVSDHTDHSPPSVNTRIRPSDVTMVLMSLGESVVQLRNLISGL